MSEKVKVTGEISCKIDCTWYIHFDLNRLSVTDFYYFNISHKKLLKRFLLDLVFKLGFNTHLIIKYLIYVHYKILRLYITY